MESKGQQTILRAFYLRSYSYGNYTGPRGPCTILHLLDAHAYDRALHVRAPYTHMYTRIYVHTPCRMHVPDFRSVHSKPIGVGERYVERRDFVSLEQRKEDSPRSKRDDFVPLLYC